ncbi:ephrin-A4 isoform X4 [Syngnathoides biaculeatus]|uniref:ephrin-A4 isoform X4 n=1 Tax=Syngnathoides biaculeatus TaxID=300417 RepID=UPI002ADD3AE4|nr:ephrin-A4 isoform X4 [Syngnathoides biaculeatus]
MQVLKWKYIGEPIQEGAGMTGLTAGELSIQVNLNDYLDFYCPYYPSKQTLGTRQPETLALYLTEEAAFQGCVETSAAIKRWECNTPFAPFGSVRFSEKIQRFTPFSLGFEFLPGRHYYYSSLPADEGPPLPCMKLRVTVCCETVINKSRRYLGQVVIPKMEYSTLFRVRTMVSDLEETSVPVPITVLSAGGSSCHAGPGAQGQTLQNLYYTVLNRSRINKEAWTFLLVIIVCLLEKCVCVHVCVYVCGWGV